MSKDGDIFSSSIAQTSWPVWPRLLKPFVIWRLGQNHEWPVSL